MVLEYATVHGPTAAARRVSGIPPAVWSDRLSFVAQLPTAVEPTMLKSVPEAKPMEPMDPIEIKSMEPMEAKFMAVESEAAMAKFTAVEREGSGSEVAAASKAGPAEAASGKVRPTKAVTEATSAAKGRRTQCRAGCGDRRGD